MSYQHTHESPSERLAALRKDTDEAQNDITSAADRRTVNVAQTLVNRGYEVEVLRYCVIVIDETSLRASDDALLNQLGVYWESRPSRDECVIIPRELYDDYRDGDSR